jgi:fermentation-respiration switch protein FrsA (DUF1100 family)
MSAGYIVFSHGQDGEPWGTKIVAMAEVAKRHGLSVESVDYRGMADPATRGMFLLAPAFFMPGYEQYTPKPADCPIEIVHGWNDDVVPVDNSVRFARQYRATLHVLDSDHRLTANLAEVCHLLDGFLQRVLATS